MPRKNAMSTGVSETNGKEHQAVKAPQRFENTDWHTKIEKANEARRAGQAAREGKPASFSKASFSDSRILI